jgi:hypothetical protein
MKMTKAPSNKSPKLLTFLFFVAMLVTLNSVTALAQSTDYWTTTGSASVTEDEANPAKPTYTNQTAAINGGPTGPVGLYVLRYSVTAVDGLFNSSSAFMRIRLRDNGAGANVLVRLRRSSVALGGIEEVASFNSDTLSASSGFRTTPDVPFTHTFDFTNYVYWVEVALNRTDEFGIPGFGGIIIGTM